MMNSWKYALMHTYNPFGPVESHLRAMLNQDFDDLIDALKVELPRVYDELKLERRLLEQWETDGGTYRAGGEQSGGEEQTR